MASPKLLDLIATPAASRGRLLAIWRVAVEPGAVVGQSPSDDYVPGHDLYEEHTLGQAAYAQCPVNMTIIMARDTRLAGDRVGADALPGNRGGGGGCR